VQLPAGRRIAPSILASDFTRIGEQVAAVMDAGARVIHVDVMDGNFVPSISIGAQIVSALESQVHNAGGYLDVHLMVDRPEHQVETFAAAGSDGITVHLEATPHVHYALKAVREAGCTPGLVINPGTAIEQVAPLIGSFELLLCMTVNPGWGGQAFIEGSTERIARLRELIGPDTALEVDGGIDERTAGPCAEAGATLFVSGSAIFAGDDPAAAYRAVAAAAGAE
jgi:ribulose-phosphate 3-epimerase